VIAHVLPLQALEKVRVIGDNVILEDGGSGYPAERTVTAWRVRLLGVRRGTVKADRHGEFVILVDAGRHRENCPHDGERCSGEANVEAGGESRRDFLCVNADGAPLPGGYCRLVRPKGPLAESLQTKCGRESHPYIPTAVARATRPVPVAATGGCFARWVDPEGAVPAACVDASTPPIGTGLQTEEHAGKGATRVVHCPAFKPDVTLESAGPKGVLVDLAELESTVEGSYGFYRESRNRRTTRRPTMSRYGTPSRGRRPPRR